MNSSSILSKAKTLGAIAAVAAAPAATQAITLTLDYSVSADYSNSGWFMGGETFDDAGVDGTIIAGGFKLWGVVERDDSMFWRWDNQQQKTVPRSDATGIIMAWGGKILGATTSLDVIKAPYEFAIEFAHTIANEYDSPYVNAELVIGWGEKPDYEENYDTPREYDSAYVNGTNNSASQWFSYDTAGGHEEDGEIEVSLQDTDGSKDLFWFASLAVNFNHEYANSWYWDDNYSKLNGDTMSVVVPQNSIDVTYVPGAQTNPGTPNSVPDGGSFAAIYALLGLGMMYRLTRKR